MSSGLERTLGTPGNVTINFNFSTTNITVLSRDQVNYQAGLAFRPETCGQCGNAQVGAAQQAYPNQGTGNASVALPQQAYQSALQDRQSVYQRPTTYEAHWQTDTGAMSASYNTSVSGYLGAAASVPMAREAAAMDGYAKANAAEQARQSAAYAGK
jgi:hypothetical protein